jgi:glycyl-tRNA synthetase alpha subunit
MDVVEARIKFNLEDYKITYKDIYGREIEKQETWDFDFQKVKSLNINFATNEAEITILK